MKKIIFSFLIASIFISCHQNPGKHEEVKSNPADSILDHNTSSNVSAYPDATGLSDSSLPIGSYIMKADSVYIYNSPDSLLKSKSYLLKTNVVLSGYIVSGNFVYIRNVAEPAKHEKGWVLLKDLEKIEFMPPKVSN